MDRPTAPTAQPAFIRTPEQIQLANERKAKKKLAANSSPAAGEPAGLDAGRILLRDWITVRPPHPGRQTVRVMTWNMLAQSLVRRELFPGSDCLKTKDRGQMLVREILHYGADLVCLQEVDRLSSLLPPLSDIYDHSYASGPGKLHGCMILYRRNLFRVLASRVVQYDQEEMTHDVDNLQTRRGATRRTKNIGLMVAFHRESGSTESCDGDGCIVGTTHLFWHPRYTYERTRQSIILVREMMRFRSELKRDHWPCFMAGDFNSQPTEPAYCLLVGEQLTTEHEKSLQESRVVHVSLDLAASSASNLAVGLGQPNIANGEEEEEDGDPDRLITGSRRARDTDGLLDTPRLTSLLQSHLTAPVRSAYDEAYRRIGHHENTFGARQPMQATQRGAFEPMWTSFTPLWRLTLDYIFIIDGSPKEGTIHAPEVVALLTTHTATSMEPGLPRKGVCASDHVALAADIEC